MKRTGKISNIVLVGILLLIAGSNQAFAQGDTWTTKTPMLVPLDGVAAAASSNSNPCSKNTNTWIRRGTIYCGHIINCTSAFKE